MATINPNPGKLARIGDDLVRIVESRDLDVVLVEFVESGKRDVVRLGQLSPYIHPRSRKEEDLETVTGKRLEGMWRLEPVLRELDGMKNRTREVMAEKAALLGCGVSTLYEDLKFYRAQGHAPTRRKRPGGKDKSRLGDARETLLQELIDKAFATAENIKPGPFARSIESDFIVRGLEPVAANTVRKRIKARSQRSLTRQRQGAAVADEKFNLGDGYSPTGTYPLEVIQIDHTPADLRIVSDDEYRLPINRPYLTLAIDEFSRCVVAFILTLRPPSAVTVALCLDMMMRLKDDWLRERGLTDVEWPIYGRPRRIFTDNAPEFSSSGLMLGAKKWGIDLQSRPLGSPKAGGIVERLIGTTAGEFHLVPGTTKSHPVELGDYDPDEHAALTLGDAEKYLALQLLGKYHLDWHTGIEAVPLKHYKRGFSNGGRFGILSRGLPTFEAPKYRLMLDFLPFERLTVQPSYGIRLFLRDFKTPPEPLEAFLDREGENRQKHIVRYDPRNLSRVFLYDERIADYHEIRCDPTLPAITLDEHEEARRALAAQRKLDVDAHAIAKHVMEARALVEQARLKTRRARRQIEDRRSAVQAASTPMLDYAATPAPTALLPPPTAALLPPESATKASKAKRPKPIPADGDDWDE